MQRVRSTLLGLVLFGCSSSEASLTPDVPSAAGTDGDVPSAAVVEDAPPPKEPLDEELLARLAKEKLAGFVVADPRAMYFPTASAARASTAALQPEPEPDPEATPPKPKPKAKSQRPKIAPYVSGVGLTVLEDLGDVVRVSTKGVDDLWEVDRRFELEVFVRRAALMPVLRAPRKESFADGTAVLLREGVVIEPLRTGARPASGILWKVLAGPIPAADVALSFQPPAEKVWIDPAPPAIASAELGCERHLAERDKLRIRIEERSAMIAKQAQEEEAKYGRPRGIGLGYGGDQWAFRCTLGGGDSSVYAGVENAALLVDGRELGRASDAPLDGCSGSVRTLAVAGEKDAALVSISLGRAEVRARTSTKSLIESGGCGAGYGFAGRARPMVKAVRRKAVAYFPDGAQAGVHTSSETKLGELGAVSEVDGRTCVKPSYLSVALCFDAADLVDVKD